MSGSPPAVEVTADGVLMFGLLTLVAFSGYDLKSEDGVTTLVRHGQVLRQWGGPTTRTK